MSWLPKAEQAWVAFRVTLLALLQAWHARLAEWAKFLGCTRTLHLSKQRGRTFESSKNPEALADDLGATGVPEGMHSGASCLFLVLLSEVFFMRPAGRSAAATLPAFLRTGWVDSSFR